MGDFAILLRRPRDANDAVSSNVVHAHFLMLVLLRTPPTVVIRTITTLRRRLNARRFIGAQLLTTESTAKRGILASTHLAAIPKEQVKHKKICAGLCKNTFFGRGFSSPGISNFSAFSRFRIACGGFYVVGVAVKGWEVVRGSNGGFFCCGGSALVWGLMVVTCKTGNQGSRNTNLITVWAIGCSRTWKNALRGIRSISGP